MKNILGKEENLELFNKKGKRVYAFSNTYPGVSCEWTYDSNGNVLTFKSSCGFSWERTYDSMGNELTYKNSDGITRGI